MAEINLTSLLDVAFVLLIAFMIVAPSLKYGVEIKLPSVREGAPQLPSTEFNLATIGIPRAAGLQSSAVRTFLLDGEPVDSAELESRLKEKRARIGDKFAVEIQADREAPYEAFVQAVTAVRRAGVEAVGLPVDATQSIPATTSAGVDSAQTPSVPPSAITHPPPAAP